MNELISVIVPIYNMEKYLNRCLDSLEKQTYPNIEFILVDDGSKDRSGEICREYTERDTRFQYYRKENGGVSSARNYGIEHANGVYLAYCDSDDWVEPEMYASLYRLIQETNADIAINAYVTDDYPPNAQAGTRSWVLKREDAFKASLLGHEFQGYVWQKLFRKEIAPEIRFSTDIKLYEDELYCAAYIAKANTVAFRNDMWYHYCTNEGTSVTHKADDSIWTAQIGIKRISDIAAKSFPDLALYADYKTLTGHSIIARMLSRDGIFTRESCAKIRRELQVLPHRKEAIAMLPKAEQIEVQLILHSRIGYILGKKLYKALKG